MDNQFEHTSIPIAVTGMACRLPGADDLGQFWEMLRGGGCAVVELPRERLDQELYYHPKRGTRGKTYSKLGAIVNSRQFDRKACPIPPQLERSVDGAHLLMCQTACEALRQAKLDPFNVPLRNTGVFIGHAQGSNLAGDVIYHTCIEEAAQFLREIDGFGQLPAQDQDDIIRELVEAVRSEVPALDADSPDVATNMIAGVIAKAFRLTGPFLSLNSACASSLHSILLAARALQLGRVDMAIAGGASDCKSDSLVLFSHAQSLSATGTRPFDSGADGLICGEGYAALVLKTLPRALADGDPIQAVLLGFGVSSDGRGKSLWAPRKEGQVKAMERAYRHGLDMATLQYVEAHATSTPLGDATELNALGEILGAKFPPGKKVPISSVKANIGHALETAGVSSLIKTVLCLQHREFVPAINVGELNPKINWESAPFYIPREPEPWPEQPDGSARRAAVNAFGIGGLNMHVVVEEFTEDRRAALAARYAEPEKPATAEATHRADDDDQAVAIIGRGCIFPDAPHPAKFWELIASGRDPKGPTPAGRWRTDLSYTPGARSPHGTPTILGGYISDFSYDWRAHKLPPRQIEQADPLQFMLLEAADQALQDSGYDKKEFDRTRVGVLVGSQFGSEFGTQLELGLRLPHIESILHKSFASRGVAPQVSSEITDQLATVLLKHWPALVDESGSFSTSTLASRITKTMNLMGGAAAIDAGDASAAAVLSISIDQLLSGDCDMMICAGGQRHMNLPLYIGVSLTGALSTSDHPRSPLDAAADGIVPGEGVGVVILKRLADARRDGDRIHAIIRGVGAGHSLDACEGMQLAMSRAFDIAGVAPSDVALIEMDGAGPPGSGQEQLRAVVAAYGQTKRDEPLLLSSITAQIGHTAGASAMASLIKATFEVETGQMPATFGLDSPLPIVAENAGVISTATKSVPIRHTTRDGRRFAAVSSSSKGQAYHILLERGQRLPVSDVAASPAAEKMPLVAAKTPTASAPATPIAAASPANDCRIYRVGAATPNEVTAALERALADPTAAFASAGSTRFTPADRTRLAIVAGGVDALAKKLKLAAKQFANPDARTVLEQQGCFYRQTPVRKPRIAFLFAGQGSHYAGMLRELVRDVPAAAAAMRKVDEVMSQRGYQTFSQMAWEHPEQLGSDVWATQVVMLLADIIVHAAVTDLGIKPDLVAGHSYGEFAALTAAGAWDLEGVVTAARARYDAIEATPTARGTLMATTAPPTAIEQAAAALAEPTYIANYNAPDQTVVGGSPQALGQLAQQLSGQGHKAQMLTVPCPYHTPLLEGAGAILKRTLDSLRLRPPRVPLLSTVTNKYVAEPEEIRENLAAQLTTPVRFVDLINRIADEQDTVFIEIGPQQALTKLTRRILDGRTMVGVIATDNAKHPGVEQLYQVRAMLECLDLFGEPAVAGSSSPAVAHPSEVAATRSPQPAMTNPSKGTITHFDATQRRIEKKRQMASGKPQTGNGRQPAPVSPATPGPNGDNRNGGQTHAAQSAPIARNGGMPSHAPAPAPVVPRTTMAAPAPASVAPAPAASAPAPASPVGSLEPAELEKFLVNFVVEQTGYPPEVVELDVDLEADLGIDSIKKAQLFGELAEYFDVQPDENMSLDDFPTLRHVVNFLAGAPLKGDLPGGTSTTAAPAPAAQAAAPTAIAPAPAPVATAPAPAPIAPAPAPVAPAPAASAPASSVGSLEPAELEKFLVNFVVEQTGYPPEVVELDVDLEADLGIDSIKKAQLFGELAEYFDVQPDENMSLDDFPTLRHVVNFLAGAPLKGDLPGGTSTTAAPAPSAQAAAPVAPAAIAPAPAPVAPAAIAPSPTPAAATASSVGSLEPAELEKFLINFVVEQTGYPPEVVELDVDLEADLGIDSIKKAQLFGELAEYFDVQPDENLSLDDFPTLRHVVNFLAGSGLKKNLTPNPSEPIEPDSVTISARSVSSPAAPEPISNGAPPAPTAAATSAPTTRPSGSPRYEAGLARGRQQRVEILRRLREYADLAGPEFDDVPASQSADADLASQFAEGDLDELHGLAAGVRVSLAAVLAHGRALLSENGAAAPPVERAPAEIKTPVPSIEPPVTVGPEYDLEEDDDVGDDTHRFYMRELAMPLKESVGAMPQWHGAALIVGENSLGDALRRQLEASGVVVRQLPVSESVDETIAAFDRTWSEQPTPHLFIVTAHEPAADPSDDAAWRRRWYRTVWLPYFLCQRWVQRAGEAKLLDQCTLVATTRLNGTFGFSGGITSPECGALTGLIKAIYIEVAHMRNNTGMRTKAIDAPDDEPVESLAANICRELASGEIDFEVAYARGVRFVQCAYPQKAPVQKVADIRVGGTWVVTGGARGITAACALELGRRFGLKLHLIGSSPLSPIDPAWRNLSAEDFKALKAKVMREARGAGKSMEAEWSRAQRNIEIDRSLRAFDEAGVRYIYHACDVSKRDELASVLATIRRTEGPIEGILHGAGIERAASFEKKTPQNVQATIGAKVEGALNLMLLTENDPVRWFVGFGSIAGRLGGHGQTDYCLASDMLCKLATWYRTRRPDVHSVSFHWHAWDEVGMAARPESAAAMRIVNGPSRMPKREGLGHLLRELYAGAPESEVLITSWEYHGRFYGTQMHPKSEDTAATPSSPDAPAEPEPAATWEKLPFDPTVSRHELKMVAAPLPPGAPADVTWQGPACILGQNPTALALRDRLVAAGVRVHMLPTSTTREEAQAAMEAIYASDPPRYLFLMTGRDPCTGSPLEPDEWRHRRAAGVVVPYATAQHWFRLRLKAKDKTPVTIVAATSLGGDFGFSGQVALPDGGALSGMLKSIYIEDTRLATSESRVKVIDAPVDDPPVAVVEAICRELAANDPNVEIGWSRGQRSVVRSFVRPVESLPRQTVSRGGNWVISGGARGITAVAALELGRRYGLKLHLIGRSPVPRADASWRNKTDDQLAQIKAETVRKAVSEGRSPEKDWDRVKHDIEIHDTLKNLAAAGIEATYYSCDLSSWAQLEATLDQIRRHGPIEGIVHGAGYGRPGRFATQNPKSFEPTLAGKLDGAAALMSLTRKDPVRYFIGFGSIGGRYGGNGLADYAMANDMFAKLCSWYRAQQPDRAVCCLDWQSWDEVGMAMLSDNTAGAKAALKMRFIPPVEGVEHLCRELEAGLPSSEIVITDRFFEKTFYPFVDTPAETPTASGSAGSVDVSRSPLVGKIAPPDAAGSSEATIVFRPADDPFLFDHKYRGKPLMPAVIGLEAVAEAARLASGKRVAAIRDLQLIAGLSFHTDRTIEACVRAVSQDGNSLSCELVSDFRNRSDKLIEQDRLHLRAVVEVCDALPTLDISMPEPPATMEAFEIQNNGPIRHGPTFHGVKGATFDKRGGWGKLTALSLAKLGGARPGRDWIVPATLLDAAFYVCGVHTWFESGQAFSLPSSVERVQFGRMPRDNENCLLQFECREIDSKQAIYDFTIFGEDRSVILHTEGHRVVMVKP